MKFFCLTLFAFSLLVSCNQANQHEIAKQIRHWIYQNIAYNSQEDTRDLIEIMLKRKFSNLSFLVIVYKSDSGLNSHQTNADVQISR